MTTQRLNVDGGLRLSGAGTTLVIDTLTGSGRISVSTGATLTASVFSAGGVDITGGTVNTPSAPRNFSITGGTLNLTGGTGITDITGSLFLHGGAIEMIQNGVPADGLGNLHTVEGSVDLGQGTITTAQLDNSGFFNVADEFGLPTNLWVLGDMGNSGTLQAQSGGAITIGGTMSNTGTFGLDTGGTASVYRLSNAGTASFRDGTHLTAQSIWNSGLIGWTNASACVGLLANIGTISINQSTFDASAGCDPFTDGTLTEVISAAGNFGTININGPATLRGMLHVSLGSGYTPSIGQSFDFLDFTPGMLSGTFTGISDSVFNNGGEQWVLSYDYAAGRVILTATGLDILTTPINADAPEPGSIRLIVAGLAALAVLLQACLQAGGG